MIDDCRLLEHGGLVRLILGGKPDLSGMIEEWKNAGSLGLISSMGGWNISVICGNLRNLRMRLRNIPFTSIQYRVSSIQYQVLKAQGSRRKELNGKQTTGNE